MNILNHPVQVGTLYHIILYCQYVSLGIQFLLGIKQACLMKVTEAFLVEVVMCLGSKPGNWE